MLIPHGEFRPRPMLNLDEGGSICQEAHFYQRLLELSMSKPLPLRASKRIQKELEKFQQEASNDGLTIDVTSDSVWHVTFIGAPSTLYADELYTLRVRFTDDYPMDSPEVVFVTPAPIHPHIYSNGHICLNILADDWSPALTVKSIVLSIMSMLSSATEKVPPQDNERYTQTKNRNPKQTHFVFHDDTV